MRMITKFKVFVENKAYNRDKNRDETNLVERLEINDMGTSNIDVLAFCHFEMCDVSCNFLTHQLSNFHGKYTISSTKWCVCKAIERGKIPWHSHLWWNMIF